MIDAHQHFWQPFDRPSPWDYSWLSAPELAPIRRSFLPEDLAPILAANGIAGSVFVQAQHHLDETRWALQLAAENDFLLGVVGYVDLQAADLDDQLDECCDSPWFKGVRHVVQDEPDDRFLLRPTVICGLRKLAARGIPFDLLVQPRHLSVIPELAAALPDLIMIVNHCAKPAIASGDTAHWHRAFRELDRFDNLHCKISGLVTEANWQHWTIQDLHPIFNTALETFGSERLLFGSDWPVCTLAAPYDRVLHATKSLANQLSSSEQSNLFHHNAKNIYRLASS